MRKKLDECEIIVRRVIEAFAYLCDDALVNFANSRQFMAGVE